MALAQLDHDHGHGGTVGNRLLDGDVLLRIHAHIDHMVGGLSEGLRSVNMSGRYGHCAWMPDLCLGDRTVDMAEQALGPDLGLVAN